MVFNGQDPAVVNKQKKIEEKAANNQNIANHPFWQVCDEYLIFREESGAFKHSSKGKSDFSAMMVTYAYPVIQNKDIAEILALSPRTVNKHLEHVFAKLAVENRTAAVAYLHSLVQDKG